LEGGGRRERSERLDRSSLIVATDALVPRDERLVGPASSRPQVGETTSPAKRPDVGRFPGRQDCGSGKRNSSCSLRGDDTGLLEAQGYSRRSALLVHGIAFEMLAKKEARGFRAVIPLGSWQHGPVLRCRPAICHVFALRRAMLIAQILIAVLEARGAVAVISFTPAPLFDSGQARDKATHPGDRSKKKGPCSPCCLHGSPIPRSWIQNAGRFWCAQPRGVHDERRMENHRPRNIAKKIPCPRDGPGRPVWGLYSGGVGRTASD